MFRKSRKHNSTHERPFMALLNFILIVQNNSKIFKSIPYQYKDPTGARDPNIKLKYFEITLIIHGSFLTLNLL